jgi:hypothetical protein
MHHLDLDLDSIAHSNMHHLDLDLDSMAQQDEETTSKADA